MHQQLSVDSQLHPFGRHWSVQHPKHSEIEKGRTKIWTDVGVVEDQHYSCGFRVIINHTSYLPGKREPGIVRDFPPS